MIGASKLFFFKQKTAYEMRISDWSSDVCSSDLAADSASSASTCSASCFGVASVLSSSIASTGPTHAGQPALQSQAATSSRARCTSSPRSEEHTSELQSLMRISYAVFCLKKKNKNNQITHKYQHNNKTMKKH